eukprot:CAMPEP_0177640332 /NCGR_PEP_ID=MMETSP0447-20121125/6487_1 /TAXON_ID=0 /ORGANISM="Stygamoeba regulata, Strain BSH-02190019" /LENGTH=237 /DNA_ID=CAMNT_0019142397 /DNA_START=68 /DNA_END=781 /DNA_ORIENTATION=-
MSSVSDAVKYETRHLAYALMATVGLHIFLILLNLPLCGVNGINDFIFPVVWIGIKLLAMFGAYFRNASLLKAYGLVEIGIVVATVLLVVVGIVLLFVIGFAFLAAILKIAAPSMEKFAEGMAGTGDSSTDGSDKNTSGSESATAMLFSMAGMLATNLTGDAGSEDGPGSGDSSSDASVESCGSSIGFLRFVLWVLSIILAFVLASRIRQTSFAEGPVMLSDPYAKKSSYGGRNYENV